MAATILGVGYALPRKGETNEELETRLGYPNGWIERRTGILTRPKVGPGQGVAEMAVVAADRALAMAGRKAADIGLILLATSTPDYPLPPTATLVARSLGVAQAGALDLAGACSGFLYALTFAANYTLGAQCALVIGANALSTRVNPNDMATAALFADGAGAVLLGAGQGQILASHLGGCFRHEEAIKVPAGGSKRPLSAERLARGEHYMVMHHGPRLFRNAVLAMAEAGKAAMEKAGANFDSLDWWIPHQANARLISEAGRAMGIPPRKTINEVASIGNSSAATIPIAMGRALEDRRLRPGHRLLLTSVGAGLITAGMVLRL